MAKKGKRIRGLLETVDRDAVYEVEEAVKLLKGNATA